MTHEIELEGYYPKILGSPMCMLCLGTKASYGMEVLHFQRGTGWDGLALDVTFTPDPQAEGTTVLADAGDTVAVPPTATAQATNSLPLWLGRCSAHPSHGITSRYWMER